MRSSGRPRPTRSASSSPQSTRPAPGPLAGSRHSRDTGGKGQLASIEWLHHWQVRWTYEMFWESAAEDGSGRDGVDEFEREQLSVADKLFEVEVGKVAGQYGEQVGEQQVEGERGVLGVEQVDQVVRQRRVGRSGRAEDRLVSHERRGRVRGRGRVVLVVRMGVYGSIHLETSASRRRSWDRSVASARGA